MKMKIKVSNEIVHHRFLSALLIAPVIRMVNGNDNDNDNVSIRNDINHHNPCSFYQLARVIYEYSIVIMYD